MPLIFFAVKNLSIVVLTLKNMSYYCSAAYYVGR